jgi:hypothetical protein
MNLYYFSIIVATLVGFCTLAWLLLAPIWRFLDREQEVSQQWTKEALARRRRQQQQKQQQKQRDAGAAARADDEDDGARRPPPPAPEGDGAAQRGGDPQAADGSSS